MTYTKETDLIWGVYKTRSTAAPAREKVLALLAPPIVVVVPTGLNYAEASAMAKLIEAAREE